MSSKIRRYWDTVCCFGYLWDQAGRAGDCERSIKDAEEGNCEIVISALTIAEVLHPKGEKRQLARESRDTIRGFLRRSIFVVVNVDRFIAERAQDAFWDHNIMPKDAIHLATALAAEAHYLETFDDVLIGNSRKVGGDPQLVIQKPGADLVRAETAQLKVPKGFQPGFELQDGR